METLEINEIFSSWQGEGRQTGMPAVFIRFSGCNLSCGYCDTSHENGRVFSAQKLIDEVTKKRVKNVIITGGEPLLQNGFNQIVEVLWRRGFNIHLETNGTIYQPGIQFCKVVCSPKAARPVDEKVDLYVREYKYIICADSVRDSNDGLPVGVSRPGSRSLVWMSRDISVQPCDHGNKEENEKALAIAKRISRDYGYYLSIQVHKLIGVK